MNGRPSTVRIYRILGCLAVLHAILLWGMRIVIIVSNNAWLNNFGVAMSILWFLWPIVLALHSGRSVMRFVVPTIIGGIVFFPLIHFYGVVASVTFNLPPTVQVWPQSLIQYQRSYRRGRMDAEKDLRVGHLALETYGLPRIGEREYVNILRQRYKIDIRRVGSDIGLNPTIIGHARGYNEISEAEISRRFGDHILKEVEVEAAKQYEDAR